MVFSSAFYCRFSCSDLLLSFLFTQPFLLLLWLAIMLLLLAFFTFSLSLIRLSFLGLSTLSVRIRVYILPSTTLWICVWDLFLFPFANHHGLGWLFVFAFGDEAGEGTSVQHVDV